MSKAILPSYILITPVRNEAQFIELTLKSMVQQTFRPLKWVIVSDGSTDGTDDIVCRYAQNHPWIELLRMPEREERHFAGKVHAFNAGYDKAKELCPDIIGNIDADVTFEPDHLEYLLTKFAEDPELGVGGAPFSTTFPTQPQAAELRCLPALCTSLERTLHLFDQRGEEAC